MGTIAARDCQRLLTLTEQVLAAGILMSWQAVQLRLQAGDLLHSDLQAQIRDSLTQTSEYFAFVEEDRELDKALHETMARIRQSYWSLYE